MGDNSLLLSDILKSCHQFSFFHELINLKELESTSSEFLLQYDLIKIESIVSDILKYLRSLHEVFEEIEVADIQDKRSVTWIFEGRTEILEIHKNLDSIDDIVSQLLVLLENKHLGFKEDSHEDESSRFIRTLESFDEIGDSSLKVKKFAILYKKRLDITILYDEIENHVIREIDNELNACLKQSFKILEIKTISPQVSRKVPKFNLESLTKKLKSGKNGLTLPIFTDLDQSLYDLYILLEERVKPLNMSLEFVPHALENFKFNAQDLYPDLIQTLTTKYTDLKDKTGYLNKDIKSLKAELVDGKWNEIFTFLVTEVRFLLADLEEESSLNPNKLTKELNYKISIMNQTLELLKRASLIKLLSRDELLDEYTKIDSKWSILNEKLKLLEVDSEELDEDEKLEVLSTVKKGDDVFNILPGFMRKSNKLRDRDKAFAASPSKLSRKQAIGASLSGSLDFHPCISSTPITAIKKGNVVIDQDELLKLRGSNVSGKLMDESKENDNDNLSSLTSKLNRLAIDEPEKPLEPVKESLKELIQKKRTHESRIPLPFKSDGSRYPSRVSSRPERPMASQFPSLSRAPTPSLIPRPTSRCSSQLSMRSSTSSIGSLSSRNMSRSSSSLSYSRLNLGNITNVTNNRNSLAMAGVKRAPSRISSLISQRPLTSVGSRF